MKMLPVSQTSSSASQTEKETSITVMTSYPMTSPTAQQKPPKILLKSINQQITCNLCKGYLIDATTIVECLHSFCHSCLTKHLRTEHYCPRCEMMINKAKPNIKPDATLQAIVYKLVPGLYEKELLRKRAFYRLRPEEAMLATPEQRGEDTEHLIFGPTEQISLSLEYADVEEVEDDNLELKTLKYLQCPAIFTVLLLKKFVVNKFSINTSEFYVEIMYKVKTIVLPDHYTLMDIAYIYTWKRDAPMRYFYRVRTIETKSEELPEIRLRRSPSVTVREKLADITAVDESKTNVQLVTELKSEKLNEKPITSNEIDSKLMVEDCVETEKSKEMAKNNNSVGTAIVAVENKPETTTTAETSSIPTSTTAAKSTVETTTTFETKTTTIVTTSSLRPIFPKPTTSTSLPNPTSSISMPTPSTSTQPLPPLAETIPSTVSADDVKIELILPDQSLQLVHRCKINFVENTKKRSDKFKKVGVRKYERKKPVKETLEKNSDKKCGNIKLKIDLAKQTIVNSVKVEEIKKEKIKTTKLNEKLCKTVNPVEKHVETTNTPKIVLGLMGPPLSVKPISGKSQKSKTSKTSPPINLNSEKKNKIDVKEKPLNPKSYLKEETNMDIKNDSIENDDEKYEFLNTFQLTAKKSLSPEKPPVNPSLVITPSLPILVDQPQLVPKITLSKRKSNPLLRSILKRSRLSPDSTKTICEYKIKEDKPNVTPKIKIPTSKQTSTSVTTTTTAAPVTKTITTAATKATTTPATTTPATKATTTPATKTTTTPATKTTATPALKSLTTSTTKSTPPLTSTTKSTPPLTPTTKLAPPLTPPTKITPSLTPTTNTSPPLTSTTKVSTTSTPISVLPKNSISFNFSPYPIGSGLSMLDTQYGPPSLKTIAKELINNNKIFKRPLLKEVKQKKSKPIMNNIERPPQPDTPRPPMLSIKSQQELLQKMPLTSGGRSLVPILPKVVINETIVQHTQEDLTKILNNSCTEIKKIENDGLNKNIKVYGPAMTNQSKVLPTVKMNPPPPPPLSPYSGGCAKSYSQGMGFLNYALMNASKSKNGDIHPPPIPLPPQRYSNFVKASSSPNYSPNSPQYNPNYNIPTQPQFKYMKSPAYVANFIQNLSGNPNLPTPQLLQTPTIPSSSKKINAATTLKDAKKISPKKSSEIKGDILGKRKMSESPPMFEGPPEKQKKVQSLLDSCNINLPSSLSITLTNEENDPSVNPLYQKKNSPVNNYIEILKLTETIIDKKDDDNKKLSIPSLLQGKQESISPPKLSSQLTVKMDKVPEVNSKNPNPSEKMEKKSETQKPLPDLNPVQKTNFSALSKTPTFQEQFLQSIIEKEILVKRVKQARRGLYQSKAKAEKKKKISSDTSDTSDTSDIDSPPSPNSLSENPKKNLRVQKSKPSTKVNPEIKPITPKSLSPPAPVPFENRMKKLRVICPKPDSKLKSNNKIDGVLDLSSPVGQSKLSILSTSSSSSSTSSSSSSSSSSPPEPKLMPTLSVGQSKLSLLSTSSSSSSSPPEAKLMRTLQVGHSKFPLTSTSSLSPPESKLMRTSPEMMPQLNYSNIDKTVLAIAAVQNSNYFLSSMGANYQSMNNINIMQQLWLEQLARMQNKDKAIENFLQSINLHKRES